MKKLSIAILGLAAFLGTTAHAAEINVTKTGTATISGAKVMQIVGNTFFTRLYWGDSFARFTVRANTDTKFFRATGEATTIAEISEGDILDATGILEPQSSSLTMNAATIKNSSVLKEQAALSGTVISVDTSDARQFLLSSKDRGVVMVNTASTTQFIKGSRAIDLDHVRAGDRITKVIGDYDLAAKKIAARTVLVYIDSNIFKPRNFTGKLVEAPSSPDATILKITINKTTYTVNLDPKVLILNNKKNPTTLQRFVIGDTIRFYGAIREVDDPIIDAEVVRNLNL